MRKLFGCASSDLKINANFYFRRFSLVSTTVQSMLSFLSNLISDRTAEISSNFKTFNEVSAKQHIYYRLYLTNLENFFTAFDSETHLDYSCAKLVEFGPPSIAR